jgi:hypothetical protein
MSLTKRLRVVVLLNASAGSVERQGDRRLRDVLATAFEKHGILAVWKSYRLRNCAQLLSEPGNKCSVENLTPLWSEAGTAAFGPLPACLQEAAFRSGSYRSVR